MTTTDQPADPGHGLSDGLGDVLARIAGRAADHDRTGAFPHEAFDELYRAGALNLTVPREFGGAEAGLAESVRLVRDVGAADPSVALVLAMHLINHAALRRPDNRWPAAVRREVQESTATGPALINSLRVEPDLGTPARGGLPATTAARVPGGWSLTGHKIYSTGIPGLRWLLVWARTDDPDPSVGGFLVPAGTPGYRVEETWDHLGMRATRSDDVIFDGAEIPAAYAVDVHRHADGPPPPDPGVLAWNPLMISAVYLGAAESARDWLARYLNERVPANLGKPLASLPRFAAAVGRIEALLRTAGTLLETTAARYDAGTDVSADAGLVKHTVTTAAIDAVADGLALIGNPGLSRRNPIERHYRNVLCSRIHTPQDDTILTTAGSATLSRAADDPT